MRILWLSDLEDGVMWNQNFVYERQAFAAQHTVRPWGPGFEDYDPKLTAKHLWDLYGPFDLVIIAEFFLYTKKLSGVSELGCKKAAILVDNYPNGVQMRKKTWEEHGVSIVLHRYRTGLMPFRAACPRIEFFWQAWGVDPDVYRPWGERTYDVALLGNFSSHLYPERSAFREALLKQPGDLKILELPHPTGFRYGRSLPQAKGSVIGRSYAQALASAKVAYASGGRPCYLVGKYFEIPACGTVLLAPSVPDLEVTGLRGGWSMVLEDQCNPFAQVSALIDNSLPLQEIADNGRVLMHSRHTWKQRISLFTVWFETL